MIKNKEIEEEGGNEDEGVERVVKPISPRKTRKWLSALFVGVIIVGVVWVGYRWLFGGGLSLTSADSYQAVFLDNNQVYFGKLSDENSQYPVLRDIYYLQLTRNLQPEDPDAPARPDINLVKLGTELHGPKDEMRINKDHILFVEDLKSDSQVVRAIAEFTDYAANQQANVNQ